MYIISFNYANLAWAHKTCNVLDYMLQVLSQTKTMGSQILKSVHL